MRTGHYAPDIWAQGGVATYIRRTGQAQRAEGHDVFYFSKKAGSETGLETPTIVHSTKDLFDQAKDLRLDILHLHKPVDDLPAERVPTLRTEHDNTAYCPSGSRYLAFPGRPCDRAYSVGGCLWGHLVNGCGSRRPHKIRANFERTRREMRLLPDLYTCTVSRFVKEQMVRSGYAADKVHVLHSPAPETSLPWVPPSRSGTPHFVFLGRIVPPKGLAWLLKALARVPYPVHLDVAGDGYLAGDMQKLARRLGIAEQVTFHGWIPSRHVSALIQDARAVVVPSVWHEPAGLVTLEAAALGRPVIASRTGGIPEYATDAYALLVPPNDIDALAVALTRLAENPHLAERMGRSGRHLAQSRFAMERFMQGLDRHYAAAIEQHHAGRAGEKARGETGPEMRGRINGEMDKKTPGESRHVSYD